MNPVDERRCIIEETAQGASWACRRCGAESGELPSRSAARVAADAHRCPGSPVRVSRDYAPRRRWGLRKRRSSY